MNLPLLLERIDPQKDAWATGRWLLRGDPGAGKTTLLRHFASRLARDEKRRWVPLFASLPRWLRGTGDFLEQADARLGRRGFAAGALRKALDALAEEGRLLLLLDGLDEVPRESRDEVAGVLRDLDQRWPQAPLVVTTRPIGGFQPGESFKELDLLPFDGHQRRRFLRGWLACSEGRFAAGAGGPSGGGGQLVRGHGLLPLAREPAGPGGRSPADGSGVGICLPGGDDDALLERRRGGGSGAGRLVRRQLGGADASGRGEAGECLGALRPPRQRLGMV